MKKKIVCLLTALTVLSCAVPVFAAGSSTAAQPVVKVTTEGVNVEQTVEESVKAEVNVKIETEAKAMAEQLVTAGKLTLTEAQKAEVKASVVAVVDVDFAGEISEGGLKVTFNLEGVKAGENIVLLHQKHDGTWETIIPDSVGDGEITATFTSLSPVAIVKVEVPKTEAGTDGEKAPKTGVLPVLPAAALVCAAGAVACGRKAKAE